MEWCVMSGIWLKITQKERCEDEDVDLDEKKLASTW